MQLDEETARLRALGEGERGALDESAQARIAARIGTQGPRVVRRARQVRRAWQLAGTVCALGLTWGALRVLTPAPQPVASSQLNRPQQAQPVDEVEPAPSVVTAPTAVPACATRSAQEPQLIADARADGERIAVGELGTIAVEPKSALWLDMRDPCAVRVRLLDGKVLVHAADLGGGELRVVTDRGDVVVHGTRFAVTRSARELTVDVAEGKVAVVHHGHDVVPLIAGGQRARIAAGAEPAVEPLSDSERSALLARLEAPAPSAQPAAVSASASSTGAALAPRGGASAEHAAHAEPAHAAKKSAAELVQEADALWHDGQLELARARYRQAGALSGPTAEAAWLALARRELQEGRAPAAQSALDDYAAHFSHGALRAEAAGIAFRVALQRNDRAAARKQAELLARRYPHTPQAEAATRWLAENPAP